MMTKADQYQVMNSKLLQDDIGVKFELKVLTGHNMAKSTNQITCFIFAKEVCDNPRYCNLCLF